MNCKLPWTSGGSKELKNCTTSDHLMNFKDLSISMMYLGEPNYYNLTKCLQPCKYYHFYAKQVIIYIQCYIAIVIFAVFLDASY